MSGLLTFRWLRQNWKPKLPRQQAGHTGDRSAAPSSRRGRSPGGHRGRTGIASTCWKLLPSNPGVLLLCSLNSLLIFVMTAYICSFSFTAIHQELRSFARNRAIISLSWDYFHTPQFSPLSRRVIRFIGNSRNTKVNHAQLQSFKRCPKLSIYLGTAPLAVLASFPHWQGLAAAALYAFLGLWAVLLACYIDFVDKHVQIVVKYIFKTLESKEFKTDLENWISKTPGFGWFSQGEKETPC